jgi:hypothetical protein
MILKTGPKPNNYILPEGKDFEKQDRFGGKRTKLTIAEG